MTYRYEAQSPEAVVQLIAASYLRHGFYWYVTGSIPSGKDPVKIDRKLIAKYGIEVSEWQRRSRKQRGMICKMPTFGLDVSPSGRTIAVVSNDSTLRFIDYETLHEFHSVQVGPRVIFINYLQYTDDGRYLITANANGTATVIAANESIRKSIPEMKSMVSMKVAAANATVNSMQFTKDGRLVTASSAGDIAVWDSVGAKISEVNLGREVYDFVLDPTNEDVFAAGVGGLVQRVSLMKSDDRIEFNGYESSVHVGDVALNTDGSRLVTCGSDGFVRIWNTETNEQQKSWAVPGVVRCEVLSVTGFVAATGNRGEVSLWGPDGRRVAIQNQEQRYMPGLVSCTKGTWIATADYGNEAPNGWAKPRIVLRDSNELEPIQSFEADCKSLSAVALSSNGRYLAVAGKGVNFNGWWQPLGKSMAVYDLYTGQKLSPDLLRGSSFRSLAFLHDGRSLAFGNGNGGVEVAALPEGSALPEGLDPVCERMVAQRVLQAGGRVHVMFPEKAETLEIVASDQIPLCAMWIDRFYLPEARSIPSGLFELLPSLYRLRDINVWGSAVNDSHMESIAKCLSLDGLLLNGTTVTDRGLAQLRGHQSLKRVVVQNRPMTDAGLASIVSIPTLKQLLVDGTSISDHGLLALTEIQRFEVLEMTRTRLTDQMMTVVSKAENLQILRLSGTMVTAESLPKIAELKSLRGLTLDGTSVKPQDCHVLVNLESLRYLALTKDDTTTAELEKLRAAMPWCEITVH